MYSTLGWINILLLLVITAPYWLLYLNKKIFHTKNKSFFKAVKGFRKIHKPLGLLVIIIGVIHGYLALGTIRIHTGTLLWIGMLLTGALGIGFYFTKKKAIFKWHKAFALVTVALLIIHLFIPGALYNLF